MPLNFGRTRPPGGSSHEIRELVSLVGKTRRNASVDLICALLMPAIRVIDTPSGSPKGHYVNRFVRGFGPPRSHRISSAYFKPSRLRCAISSAPRSSPSHSMQARCDAFRRRNAVRGIQARRDDFDTGRPTHQSLPRKPVRLGTRRYASSLNIWVPATAAKSWSMQQLSSGLSAATHRDSVLPCRCRNLVRTWPMLIGSECLLDFGLRFYGGNSSHHDPQALIVVNQQPPQRPSRLPCSLDSAHRSGEQVVTPQTLRRRFFSRAGRLTRSARRLTLHLSGGWPWQEKFSRAPACLRAIPPPT